MKCVTDNAHGPLHTTHELRLPCRAEFSFAQEEDARNEDPRMSVEMSFKNIVQKFTHADLTGLTCEVFGICSCCFIISHICSGAMVIIQMASLVLHLHLISKNVDNKRIIICWYH